MLSTKKICLILTYLVGAGSFASFYGIADDLFLLFLFFLFLLGVLNDFKFRVYPPRWFLNSVGILLSTLFLSELSLENMVKPFINVLMLLLVIKSHEDKKPRDIYQMLLLSLFGVAVTTTFRLDISFLIFFLYELFLGVVAFTFTNAYANLGEGALSSAFLKKYTRFSLLLPILTALASIPFFITLPRTQTPLFDLFTKKEKGLVSGVADEVELGKVGNIQQDNTVVMRVYGTIPKNPYWRVSVFDTFLNRKWIRTLEEPEPEPSAVGGKKLGYTIILEPTYDTFIPLLDYPERILKVEGVKRTQIIRRRGGYYTSSKAINRPLRYRALSSLHPTEDPVEDIYLQLPEDVPKRIAILAEKLSRGKVSDEEKLESLIAFFKNGFSYTLKLEDYDGDPLEDFLFERRRGNCEYFASATALLLRLMGIPSRVIGGFKGALKNEYGDYYIVTNSMAHVWVEAYVGGRWVRVDTTPPYVSPAIKEISRMDLLRDALLSFWYENVVDFSAQKQISLLKRTISKLRSLDLSSLKKLKGLLIYLLYASFLLFIVHVYLHSIRKTPSNLYRKLISVLERKEGEKLSKLLPEEVLKKLADKPYYREVKFIIDIYRKHRFSPYKVSKREVEEGYKVLRKIY